MKQKLKLEQVTIKSFTTDGEVKGGVKQKTLLSNCTCHRTIQPDCI